METRLFEKILSVESTSGTERGFAEFMERLVPSLSSEIGTGRPCSARRFEVGDGTVNLLFSWGTQGDEMPEVSFCTHLDTVPPYFPPHTENIAAGTVLPDGNVAAHDDVLITGRGSNDAKGQIFSMLTACLELQGEGFDGSFGLLLLAGEETGSYGAKAFTAAGMGGEWVIVGEPTCNRMVSASKGTKSFRITLRGKACHSGYPELGESAVMKFNDFVNDLKSRSFDVDPVLGETTWNIGSLVSSNPQNILSPELSFRLYFRTTFSSDARVIALPDMWKEKFPGIEVEAFGGDTPMHYDILPGYETAPVSFGSDTPRLTGFRHRAMFGPGSIFVAHTPREYVLLSDLGKAVEQYKKMVALIHDRRS
ncbi:MAG: M20/M25/M40 family metallo-hydrolase [Candidatus Cryptobacteroides sp.]